MQGQTLTDFSLSAVANRLFQELIEYNNRQFLFHQPNIDSLLRIPRNSMRAECFQIVPYRSRTVLTHFQGKLGALLSSIRNR